MSRFAELLPRSLDPRPPCPSPPAPDAWADEDLPLPPIVLGPTTSPLMPRGSELAGVEHALVLVIAAIEGYEARVHRTACRRGDRSGCAQMVEGPNGPTSVVALLRDALAEWLAARRH